MFLPPVSAYTRAGNVDHLGHILDMSRTPVTYGTAGFRMNASSLPYIVYRMGALSALRSASHLGRHIGIMITASHNVEADNGVKLVEPMGEMLVVDWETAATELANAGDDTYASTLSTVVAQLGVVLDANTRMRVHIGNDTRISSSHLVAAARAGVRSVNITGVVADIIEHGLVTTPLLHYLVRTANDPSYGVSSNQGYFDKLASAFIKLIEPVDKACMASSVHVDCANGVGSMAITQFLLAYKRLQLPAHASWTISVHNTGGGELNANCGADYVKITRKQPGGVTVLAGERWASIDGDADRVVYFYTNVNGECRLLDGDAIAVLLLNFVRPLIDEMNASANGDDDCLNIGVVQSAYANGASTAYMRDVLNLHVECVPTGVKHLHAAAHVYDIGVYFEANGHGTVLFSDRCKRRVHQMLDTASGRRMSALIDLINETVGDALSDLLAVEAILALSRMSIEQWDAVYEDVPSVQMKVSVRDRLAVCTTWDETRCTAPLKLQPSIDECVNACADRCARAFVRPSGTENVVRVYAEASTVDAAQRLAEGCAAAVKMCCE